MEKPHNLVLPQLFECCVSVSRAETLKPAKMLSELVLLIIYIGTFIVINLFIDMEEEGTFTLPQI